MPSLTYLVNGVSNIVGGIASFFNAFKYFVKTIIHLVTFQWDNLAEDMANVYASLGAGITKLGAGVGEVGLSIFSSLLAPATLGATNGLTDKFDSFLQDGIVKLAETLEQNPIPQEIFIAPAPVTITLDGREVGYTTLQFFREQENATGKKILSGLPNR